MVVGQPPPSPPKPGEEFIFNGNFEKWFAKDEYIPRPKLVELDERNRAPDDLAAKLKQKFSESLKKKIDKP